MQKKKMTRKQIEEKYEALKIDTQRRLAELRESNSQLQLGAAQLQQAVDLVLGAIAHDYGERSEDGLSWTLRFGKLDRPLKIESRVWTDKDEAVIGTVITATEVEDE